MPFNSRAYRVLIASPSDVEEEREIAVRVIQQWNDLYAYTRGVVLLPLRWETHSAPDYGTRPQEVINRAMVDHCDLLIGIFWTRIGTPTGAADSGTLEEISRVARAGKPIMLYFSNIGMEPDRIDLEQLRKLNAFKSATYPNALTESYKSQVDFRDKLARQLELKVRDIQISDVAGAPPPLDLLVATEDLKSMDNSTASRCVELVEVVDLEEVLKRMGDREEHMKKMIDAYVARAATVPIALGIANTGPSGIKNLYAEMAIAASKEITVSDKEPRGYQTWESYFSVNLDRLLPSYEWKGPDITWEYGPELREGFSATETGWRLTFEWSALQPNRKRLVSPSLFVKADKDGKVTISTRVFADSLPEPVVLAAEVQIKVRKRQVRVKDLLGGIDSAETIAPEQKRTPSTIQIRRNS